ncbi:unnamed protein product, partial [Medioppia subpectinata]
VEWTGHKLRICSKNNFPTAAGLASSAAGYACLMYALARLHGIDSVETISTLARIGSGSACRSVYGGFVQWVRGSDAQTSIARQIVDQNHWPAMRVLVLVVRDTQKDTSSTSGMAQTVATSALMQHRVASVVPARVEAMVAAIKARDFPTFAEITMRDSNQFHAVCEDTYPPLTYMNDTSRAVRRFCHRYNDFHGPRAEPRVAYTFDAGPNACLYLLDRDVAPVLALLGRYHKDLVVKGSGDGVVADGYVLPPELAKHFDDNPCLPPDAIRYVISTRVGAGPQLMPDESECLLNAEGYECMLLAVSPML